MRLIKQWVGAGMDWAVPAAPIFTRFTAVLIMTLSLMVAAQSASAVAVDAAVAGESARRSVSEWLMRLHEAARQRSYVGTFVVSGGGYMSSARIWHVCDGAQQIERVESLTGAPRSTFRRNDQVMSFLPESRVAVAEKRESLGLFPSFLHSNDSSIGQFYRVQFVGRERVAGYVADVLELSPADNWRFGYQIWSEQKTGLLLKLQTLDGAGQVLEQAAFSELQIDVPVDSAKLLQMMEKTAGYRIETPEMVKTTASAEGWLLQSPVPGFKPMSCFMRAADGAAKTGKKNSMQWIFSDGLASVSLFAELFDSRRHVQSISLALGATHTLTRRIGDWWVTAVGEVPPSTLAAFVQRLERTK